MLATVTSAEALSAAINGLGSRGELIVVGASGDPITVSPVQLIGGNRSVVGHASGTSIDSQDTLAFQRAQRRATGDRDLAAGARVGGL